MSRTYELLMARESGEFEQELAQAVQAHAWMGVQEAEMLRQAGAVWTVWALGEAVDIGLLAGAFLGLAESAEAAGDELGRWVFDQSYQWVEALTRGEEYVIPAFPEALAGLVGGNEEVPDSSRQW